MLELSRSTLSFCRHWMMNSNVGLRIEMPYYVKLTSDDTTSLTPHLIVSKSLSDITGEVVSTVIHLNSVVVCYGSAVIPTDSQVTLPLCFHVLQSQLNFIDVVSPIQPP